MASLRGLGALALAWALCLAEARLGVVHLAGLGEARGDAPLRSALGAEPAPAALARGSLTSNASLSAANASFQVSDATRTFRNYINRCERSREAEAAVRETDQGNATAYSRKRSGFVYMRDTWCALRFLGAKPTSIVDVGSSWPPFLRSVNWMKGDRTIVSKYFPSGGGPVSACKQGGGKCKDPHSDIQVVMEDFYEWKPDKTYDVVLCSQVLEHVDDPKRFLRKLLATGRTVLASVPYHWKDYNLDFHKHHYLGLDDMRTWAGRDEIYSFVAEEDHGGSMSRRLLAVFQGTV